MAPSRQSSRINKPTRKSRFAKASAKPTLTVEAQSKERRSEISNKLKLLLLPDEPLIEIMRLLCTQSPSFKAPPAFRLALTNTRLFRIFKSVFTRITPYISNPTLPTLSTSHLAAVARLAGGNLRVLHVPEGALWGELADDCPNVEELAFHDDWASEQIFKYLVEKLPLHQLEIHRPSNEVLALVPENLDKLTLKEVGVHNVDAVLSILENPPRIFVLHLDFRNTRPMGIMIEALKEAIPKMEKAEIRTLTLCPQEMIVRKTNTLRKSKKEGHKTRCNELSLSGAETFKLLRCAGLSTKVTVGDSNNAIRNDGPGLPSYLTKTSWRSPNQLLPQHDPRHLEELEIYVAPSQTWIERLPPLRHVKVCSNGLLPELETDVLSIPIPTTPFEECNLKTRELRIVGNKLRKDEIQGFCQSIQQIMKSFTGKVVWMDHVRRYELPDDKDAIRPFVRCAKYSCEYFEQEGGDAGSVLSWLDDVYGNCF